MRSMVSNGCNWRTVRCPRDYPMLLLSRMPVSCTIEEWQQYRLFDALLCICFGPEVT